MALTLVPTQPAAGPETEPGGPGEPTAMTRTTIYVPQPDAEAFMAAVRRVAAETDMKRFAVMGAMLSFMAANAESPEFNEFFVERFRDSTNFADK